jgi:hypothetical protein
LINAIQRKGVAEHVALRLGRPCPGEQGKRSQERY